MRFSYDTLQTENSMMIAEIAAQRDRIDDLITQVKNGNWALSKAKKESETLRSIMKGYIATIDSVNQLNIALTEENLAIKEQFEPINAPSFIIVRFFNFPSKLHVIVPAPILTFFPILLSPI